MVKEKVIRNRIPIHEEVHNGIWGKFYEKSPINQLIQSKYLSSSGTTELKTRLFRILTYLPAFQIGLVVSYKPNTLNVAKIALKCVFDEDRIDKTKIPFIENEVNSYFNEIGFNTIEPSSYNEMVEFLDRLKQDIPQVEMYFEY